MASGSQRCDSDVELPSDDDGMPVNQLLGIGVAWRFLNMVFLWGEVSPASVNNWTNWIQLETYYDDDWLAQDHCEDSPMDDSPTGVGASDTAVELPSDPDETLDALTFLSVKYHRPPLFLK